MKKRLYNPQQTRKSYTAVITFMMQTYNYFFNQYQFLIFF